MTNLSLGGCFAESNRRMNTRGSKSPGWGECGSFKTAAAYRVMAAQCFKRARTSDTDEARQTYLQLARFWLDVASKLDGPPGSKPKGGFRLWLARLQT